MLLDDETLDLLVGRWDVYIRREGDGGFVVKALAVPKQERLEHRISQRKYAAKPVSKFLERARKMTPTQRARKSAAQKRLYEKKVGRKVHRVSMGPALKALHAEAKPGCCIACDKLLEKPRRMKHPCCGAEDCKAVIAKAQVRDSYWRKTQ